MTQNPNLKGGDIEYTHYLVHRFVNSVTNLQIQDLVLSKKIISKILKPYTIKLPVSSIEYPASSIQYRASSNQQPVLINLRPHP